MKYVQRLTDWREMGVRGSQRRTVETVGKEKGKGERMEKVRVALTLRSQEGARERGSKGIRVAGDDGA